METIIKFKREYKKYSKDVKNTRRVERVLLLIKFLKEFRNRKEIATHLDIHIKSVSRYINLLSQLGFKVETGHSKLLHYRLVNVEDYFN